MTQGKYGRKSSGFGVGNGFLVCQVALTSNSVRPRGPYSPWNSPSQNTGVGCYFRLQGIFPTQGSNPRLLQWQAGGTGDAGSIPGRGRSPGEGDGKPFRYSWLGNPTDRGGWLVPDHGIAKGQARLSDFHFHFTVDRHIEIVSMSWLL